MIFKQIPEETIITFNNLSRLKEEYGSESLDQFYEIKKKMLVQQGLVSSGNFSSSALTTKTKGNAN